MHVIEDEDISAFVEDRSGKLHQAAIAVGQESPVRFGNFSDRIFYTACPRVLGRRAGPAGCAERSSGHLQHYWE
jgi:hypothetical protein